MKRARATPARQREPTMQITTKFVAAVALSAALLSAPAARAADLVVATDTAFVPF
jgi:hypothetical protein